MSSSTTKSSGELAAELAGTRCRCGRVKRAGRSLCYRCFTSLPGVLRGALYRRFGKGYEEAYAAAAENLDRRRAS